MRERALIGLGFGLAALTWSDVSAAPPVTNLSATPAIEVQSAQNPEEASPSREEQPPPKAAPKPTLWERLRGKVGFDGKKRDTRPAKRWMLGVEGVVMQAPPARVRTVDVDKRFIGRSIAMGGLGLLARYRIHNFVGFDLGVRSGSVRYRDSETEDVISQDVAIAELGALVYLGRGDIAQFALSGGLGGMFNRFSYDLEGTPNGRQIFGSATFRVGAEAEFVVKRVAFILSFRAYGIVTPRGGVRNVGSLFDNASAEEQGVPVARYQSYLVGAAGIAYRF